MILEKVKAAVCLFAFRCLFICGALAVVTNTLHAQEKTEHESIVLARELMDAELFEQAAQQIRKAIAYDSTQAEWFFLLGNCYQELNMPKGAYAQYSYAIDLEPTLVAALNARAVLQYSKGLFREAIVDYTTALEHVTDDRTRAALLMNRAGSKQSMRKFDEAYDDLLEAYSIDSTSTSILNNLGTLVDELGMPDRSLEYFNAVLALDSGFVEVYNNIGFVYLNQGHYEKALGYFEQLIALRPEMPYAYNNKGYCLYKLNRFEEALSFIDKSLQYYPTNAYAFRNRALVYLALNQSKQACMDMEEALKYGFTGMYGNEVLDLMLTHCN